MTKRTCLLCQTKYDYCPRCNRDQNKPRWMTMFHDENCKQIFDTLQRNEQKLDSDEESISKLKACDLSVLRHATEAINNQVQRLLDKEVKQQEIIAVDEICEPDKEVVEETIQPKRKPKRAKKNEMHSE